MDQSRRILLVDDNVETSKLFKEVLVLDGFDVSVAYDGQEALERLKVERFDLVLLDIQMPKLDGIGFLEKVKTDEEVGLETKVVMLTNLGDEDLVRKAISLGAMGYVSKMDTEPKMLVQRVKEVLGVK